MKPARRDRVAVSAAWRASDAVVALKAAIDAFDRRDVDAAAKSARHLLANAGLIDDLLAPLFAALAADRWFAPPIRAHRDARTIGAILCDTPAARLTASVAAPAATMPPTVVVPGQVAVTRYHRAGGVVLHRWDGGAIAEPFVARAAALARPIASLTPRDGDVVIHDGRRVGHVRIAVAAVVTVTLLLRTGSAPLARAYRTADGALVQAATTDDAGSRGAMLRALLRASGRRDAAPLFAAATHDTGFDARWGAMRDWLALDAERALPRLAAMAEADPHPEVRAAATATLAKVTPCRS